MIYQSYKIAWMCMCIQDPFASLDKDFLDHLGAQPHVEPSYLGFN